MKLISLNTWGGRAGLDDLLAFFAKHKDVDIFCLQEIWSGGEHMLTETAAGADLAGTIPQLLAAIAKTLPGHAAYFRPQFYDFYGLAIFVKKNLQVTSEGVLSVYKEPGYVSKIDIGDHGRIIQHISINTPQGLKTFINLHGIWQPGAGKRDNADRLKQSDNIASFLKTLTNPYMLAGDFNLLPDTESIKKLEALGLRNLIKEYGITSTRTKYYTKPEKFADYALVSPGIDVKSFKVLPDEVSDHSPLYVEFE